VTVSASVTGTDQPTEGEYAIVDRVEVSDGGASDKEGSGDEAPWFGHRPHARRADRGRAPSHPRSGVVEDDPKAVRTYHLYISNGSAVRNP